MTTIKLIFVKGANNSNYFSARDELEDELRKSYPGAELKNTVISDQDWYIDVVNLTDKDAISIVMRTGLCGFTVDG